MTHTELTKIREEKNLTKGQFAALIGITPMLQGRYESGKIAIPDHIAEKILALDTDKITEEVIQDKTEELAKDEEKTTAEELAKDEEKATVEELAKDEEKATVEELAKDAAMTTTEELAKDTEKSTAKMAVKDTEERTQPILLVESLLGGTISVEEILERIPAGVDEVYVKPEENKAYWVKGKEAGDINLW